MKPGSNLRITASRRCMGIHHPINWTRMPWNRSRRCAFTRHLFTGGKPNRRNTLTPTKSITHIPSALYSQYRSNVRATESTTTTAVSLHSNARSCENEPTTTPLSYLYLRRSRNRKKPTHQVHFPPAHKDICTSCWLSRPNHSSQSGIYWHCGLQYRGTNNSFNA